MCLLARDRTVALAFSGGGGDREKKIGFKKNTLHSHRHPRSHLTSTAAAVAASSTIAVASPPLPPTLPPPLSYQGIVAVSVAATVTTAIVFLAAPYS
jgi:hypothetical protein